MKVGDMVKIKESGQIGLILEKVMHRVPDGNPNGDFYIEFWYKIACDDEITMIPKYRFHTYAEVINEE